MKRVALGALAAWAALSGGLAVHIGGALDGTDDVALVLAAAALGLLATDAISGFVHWLCDTYFEEDTLLLGPALIGPFRAHHRDPLEMTRRHPLEVNLSNVLAALPFLALGLRAELPAGEARALFGTSFVFFLAQAIAWTNQFHTWAHVPDPPRIARVLQRARIAIPPAHHALHHRPGSATYCITTGWLNPPLDRLRFFARLEHGIAGLASLLAILGLRKHGNQGQDRAQEREPVAARREQGQGGQVEVPDEPMGDLCQER